MSDATPKKSKTFLRLSDGQRFDYLRQYTEEETGKIVTVYTEGYNDAELSSTEPEFFNRETHKRLTVEEAEGLTPDVDTEGDGYEKPDKVWP